MTENKEKEEKVAEYFNNLNKAFKQESWKAYDKHAQGYDESLNNGKFKIYETFMKIILEKNYPKDVEIVDYGCGTGIPQEYMFKSEYKNVDGFDASKEMVEIAKKKNIYRKLDVIECGKGVERIKDYANKYDIVISIGVFGPMHIMEEGLDELVALLNPQSKVKDIIFNTKAVEIDLNNKIRAYFNKLKDEGKVISMEELNFKRWDDYFANEKIQVNTHIETNNSDLDGIFHIIRLA